MKLNKFPELGVHFMVWLIMLGFPFFFISRLNSGIYWYIYISLMLVPFTWMIVFYINYLWLVPKILFKQHTRNYIIINLIMSLFLGLCLHLSQDAGFIGPGPKPEKQQEHGVMPPNWIFFSRDILTLFLASGLGATIRMNGRWREAEAARQEAEKSKAEAELKNLKNQLNPHFLLNTLNNIYALIAFDSNKAQQALHDLSKLLRYMLYDNQSARVPLTKEADFIRNYIELMRIRLTKDITVTTNISISPESSTLIAPLIYISLIENAFKHGVSSSKPSYINMQLREDGDGKVICEIRNSNYPKTYQDQSGHGIGLEQVRKRLELIYPGRYLWEKDINGNEYRSLLVVDTK